MKHFVLRAALGAPALLAFTALCLVPACKKKEVLPPQLAQPLPRLELPHPGADLLFVSLPSPSRPLVSFRVAFFSGSIDDPAEKEGLTALTAAVMTRGGTRALSSADLAAALFPMAAELDVQVDKELTTFSGRVHKDHLQRFLPIFLDVLLQPRWDEREFDRLRTDAVNDLEKRLCASDDEQLGKEALQWLLFQGHPYQHSVGGTIMGLRSLRLDDLKAHAQRVFTRARAVIGIAGGVDAALEETLRRRLASLPAGVGGRLPLPPPPTPKTRVLILEKDTAATAISLGHTLGAGRSAADFPALFVGNSALGEHRQLGGRLFRSLREQRGLNYGNYSYVEHFAQDGSGTYPLPNVPRRQQYFSVWLRPVEHQHSVFAVRAALFEVERFVKEGLAQNELERTRGFLAGYTRMFEQTDSRRLGFAIDDQFYGAPPLWEGLRKAMPGLTTDAVNAATRKHVDVNKLRFVFITPDGDKLRTDLLAGRASPMKYASPRSAEVMETDQKIAVYPLSFKSEEIQVLKALEPFTK